MQEQLQPPHGPMGLIEPPFFVLWSDYLGILGLILLMLLIVLGWWLRRIRERKRQCARGPSPEELQWGEVFERIKQLENQLQSGRWNARDFAFQLSNALRAGMALSFKLAAPSQTLAELRTSLQQEARISSDQRQELLDFFVWSEMVQFSAQENTSSEMARNCLQKVSLCLQQWREGQR